MSVTSGYEQYLRKYRLLINRKITSTKQVTKEIPGTADKQIGTVTGSKVNYRKGPSTKYKSYGTLKKGATFEITGTSGGWYQFTSSKGVAYMSGKYVKVKTQKGTEAKTEVTSESTTDVVGIDVSDLRCTFMCEKSATETPNFSQITVYNLNQATISSIKAGDTIILEAGYENGNYGMIFTGEIVQPYTVKESGTDLALVLLVQDGDAYLSSAFTAQTVGKSSTPQDIIQVCTKGQAGKGIISKELGVQKMPRGRVLFGKSAGYISRIARQAHGQFYMEDGKINIVAASDYDENTAVELNPMTGLIGIPSQTDDGVSGQCLINPSIKLNTLLYINSKLVTPKQASLAEDGSIKQVVGNADGVYRVVKLTYEGDTRGDAWYCNFEAVAQTGTKLAGQTKDVSSPWR